jgi:iron complex outermembrane receptor protein
MSLGSRAGDFSWWLALNHTDSNGQPLTFPTKLLSTAVATPGTPVSGAVLEKDKSNNPWYVLGDATQYHTVQDHSKVKLAYDFSPVLRASYTLGWWRNDAVGQSQTYLRDAAGKPVYSGTVNIEGRNFNLAATDFNQSRESLEHLMHGLSLKSRTRGVFDWEVAASLYDYQRDLQRAPTTFKPAADNGGAGNLISLKGTGWHTLALKGVWRPDGVGGDHIVDLGVQQDRYQWRQAVFNGVTDWLHGDPVGATSNTFTGDTQLRSLYAQDAWTLSERWKAVLGLRHENWQAFDGAKTTGAAGPVHFADRNQNYLSPKAALGYQANDELTLKLSTGRAVRMPTVGELFQGRGNTDPVTNPDLRPEKSWTTEFSGEWDFGAERLRTTLFHEDTKDSLYSQAIPGTTPIVNSTQNIDHIRTWGLETALQAQDVFTRGVDLQGSLTYADSKIVENASFVATPGDTIGKQQPRVPHWRASALVNWRVTPKLNVAYGARYGSSQFGTLNNSDSNGFTYQGFSKYFTTDLRVRYVFDKQWSAALGIDNLTNATYWNFHPYPQRSYSAELKFDL